MFRLPMGPLQKSHDFLNTMSGRASSACRLLPDTEPAEDHPQQLIGRNGTSDPPQRLMGQSQFLGKEIEGLVSQRHVVAGVLQVLQCFGKCLQVALAGVKTPSWPG